MPNLVIDILTFLSGKKLKGFPPIIELYPKILTPRFRQPELQGALCAQKLDIARRLVKGKFYFLGARTDIWSSSCNISIKVINVRLFTSNI